MARILLESESVEASILAVTPEEVEACVKISAILQHSNLPSMSSDVAICHHNGERLGIVCVGPLREKPSGKKMSEEKVCSDILTVLEEYGLPHIQQGSYLAFRLTINPEDYSILSGPLTMTCSIEKLLEEKLATRRQELDSETRTIAEQQKSLGLLGASISANVKHCQATPVFVGHACVEAIPPRGGARL